MVKSDPHLCERKICIYTLGKFYVYHDQKVLNESSSQSRRMWVIFMFLLSNRGKSFFPETILGNIWPEKEYSDPSMILRAQMFRLRHALDEGPAKNSLADNIMLSQGSYIWEEKTAYWLDVDELESLAGEAGEIVDVNPEQAINLYRKAIALYKGPYLSELSFSEWLEPIRSYYHDIYMECVLNLIKLLKGRDAHKEIIKTCEQALKVDYFEEKIHLKLLEALLADEQTTRARAHYNEVTSVFYKELGIKPSERLKSIYRMITSEPGSFELDLTTIQEGLKGKEETNGAYFCDAELFRYFYKLERARVERSGQSSLLGLFTITTPGYRLPEDKVLTKVMQHLQGVVLNSLRKGDLVTRWNKAQLLLLMPGLTREEAEKVTERIEAKFREKHSLEGLIIHKKIESLLPPENSAHFFAENPTL